MKKNTKKKNKKDERLLFFQKGNITAEFCPYDRSTDTALSGDLGTFNTLAQSTMVNDVALWAIPLDDFIKQVEAALKKLKKHKGDAFVIQ